MTEVNREKSAARLVSLQKVAALDNVGTEIGGTLLAPAIGAGIGGLIGSINGVDKRPTLFNPNPQAVSTATGASIGAIAGYGANALGVLIAALVARRKRKEQVEHDSKTHLENLIPGIGAYNYTKRLGRVLSGAGETDDQLKAAEDRSAKRLEALQKCAAADRSAALRSILEKSAGLLGGGSLSAIPGKLNAAAGKLWGVTGKPLVRSVTGGLARAGDRVGGFLGRTWQGAVDAANAGVRDARLEREADNAFNRNWQQFNGVHDPRSMAQFRQQYIRNKQRSMATRQPMQMPAGSVPYQPK